MLSRTSDNTTSQNIGGDQCMGGPPHLHFWGGPSPPPPPPVSPPPPVFFSLLLSVNILYRLLPHWTSWSHEIDIIQTHCLEQTIGFSATCSTALVDINFVSK